MSVPRELCLRPGEWVEVRSESEIQSTLDHAGMLDGMPFMPEMLGHCGRRYQVFKRADKTCDTVNWTGLRRLERTVHLSMLRCDGAAHGGCQAGCLMFWKEAWLKRCTGEQQRDTPTNDGDCNAAPGNSAVGADCDAHWLTPTVVVSRSDSEVCYRCQATQISRATRPLPWWQPGQYWRDVRLNGVSVGEVARSLAIAGFGRLRRILFGKPFPDVAGTLKRTPHESLGLESGDWVVVKSKQEILATLDTKGRNRGMTFDPEMLPYCGMRFRVLRRVDRIIEETTGRLIQPPGVRIILEGAICKARYRRSCPRSIYPYWREIWLRRARPDEIPPASDREAEAQP